MKLSCINNNQEDLIEFSKDIFISVIILFVNDLDDINTLFTKIEKKSRKVEVKDIKKNFLDLPPRIVIVISFLNKFNSTDSFFIENKFDNLKELIVNDADFLTGKNWNSSIGNNLEILILKDVLNFSDDFFKVVDLPISIIKKYKSKNQNYFQFKGLDKIDTQKFSDWKKLKYLHLTDKIIKEF